MTTKSDGVAPGMAMSITCDDAVSMTNDRVAPGETFMGLRHASSVLDENSKLAGVEQRSQVREHGQQAEDHEERGKHADVPTICIEDDSQQQPSKVRDDVVEGDMSQEDAHTQEKCDVLYTEASHRGVG
eukprot:CAMPEP_0202350482 /NCGR_PEP_ID=MMETSP1126-20121109/7536_1 /ASSEMBLY_ACC=CAM_ASM_000457 /TAXON_ID=3047 /ORGANISM="Dunaliella tertiolecta, Strain CCMP1320" /LENGTH=128 /DNA_ID=CAMNT_0048942461 /DNA_START=639 /DNA_END=1024 /DNA_ORIENTATION=-